MVQAVGSQLSGVLLPADNVLNREILVAKREEHVNRHEMVAAAEGCCKKFVEESQCSVDGITRPRSVASLVSTPPTTTART